MTQDEIIGAAKEAGFNVSEGEIIVGDYGNINTITNELAKFAELIKSQAQPTPSQSVDELAEFERYFNDRFKDLSISGVESHEFTKAKSNMFFGWQARATLTKPQPTSQVLDAGAAMAAWAAGEAAEDAQKTEFLRLINR